VFSSEDNEYKDNEYKKIMAQAATVERETDREAEGGWAAGREGGKEGWGGGGVLPLPPALPPP